MPIGIAWVNCSLQREILGYICSSIKMNMAVKGNFFTALKSRLFLHVGNVDIYMRFLMQANSEMTTFRNVNHCYLALQETTLVVVF